MATIQILGTGCSRCGHLAASAAKAVKDQGRDDVVEKVTDIMQILSFQPPALPALAINGKVVSSGIVPTPKQIQQFLEEEGA
jgi:small redox-active disulfide protein 2